MADEEKNDWLQKLIGGIVLAFVCFFIWHKYVNHSSTPGSDALASTQDDVVKQLKDDIGGKALNKGINYQIESVLEDPLTTMTNIISLNSIGLMDDIDHQSVHGTTVLIGLAKSDDDLSGTDTNTFKAFVKTLFDMNPNVDITDEKQNSALFLNTMQGTIEDQKAMEAKSFDAHFYLEHILLQREAKKNAGNITGHTALDIACRMNSYKYAEILIRYGALLNATEKYRARLLHETRDSQIQDLINAN
jgi:ankyrin repeat protein